MDVTTQTRKKSRHRKKTQTRLSNYRNRKDHSKRDTKETHSGKLNLRIKKNLIFDWR